MSRIFEPAPINSKKKTEQIKRPYCDNTRASCGRGCVNYDECKEYAHQEAMKEALNGSYHGQE